MNSAGASGSWSRRHWYGVIILIFIGQLIFIFWLGQRTPFSRRWVAPGPAIRLAGPGSAQLLSLTDPTLFALPHVHGFSGPAWLNVAPLSFQPFLWTEPPRWLSLPVEQLGAAFHQFIATNEFKSLGMSGHAEPELLLPELPTQENFPTQSLLLVRGRLASRALLSPMDLPSWTNEFILSNTVIKVIVDALGQTLVAPDYKTSSGYKRADQEALDRARAARFEPLPGASKDSWAAHPLEGLAFGELVFEWYTFPPVGTNATTEKP